MIAIAELLDVHTWDSIALIFHDVISMVSFQNLITCV